MRRYSARTHHANKRSSQFKLSSSHSSQANLPSTGTHGVGKKTVAADALKTVYSHCPFLPTHNVALTEEENPSRVFGDRMQECTQWLSTVDRGCARFRPYPALFAHATFLLAAQKTRR